MLISIQVTLSSASRLAKSLTALQVCTRLKCKYILMATLLQLKCCTACCQIWCTQAIGRSLRLLTTAASINKSTCLLSLLVRIKKASLLATIAIMLILLPAKKLRLLLTFIRVRMLESACRKPSAMITATSITTTCLRVGRRKL